MRLKPELQKFIDDRVRSGDYPSAEAVIEAAVAQMMSYEAETELTPEDLAEIEAADAEAERGEVVDFDTFAAEMRRKYVR